MVSFPPRSALSVVVVAAVLADLFSLASAREKHGRRLGSTTASSSSAAQPSSELPFYLKVNNAGGTSAVIYYGKLGDASKEIHVPCTVGESDTMMIFAGPGSMFCHCETDTKCTIQAPYEFDFDASGTIVGVTYPTKPLDKKDDVLVVSFRPLKDASGVVIGAIFDDETPILVVPLHSQVDEDGNVVSVNVDLNDQSSKSLSDRSSKCTSVLVFFSVCLVAAAAILVMMISRKAKSLVASRTTDNADQSQRVEAKPMDDDITEAGSSIDVP